MTDSNLGNDSNALMLEGAFGIDAAVTANHGIYENDVTVTEEQLNRLNPPETLNLSSKYYVQFNVNLNSFIEYQDEANFDADQTTLDDAFGFKEIFVGYSGSKAVEGDLIPSDTSHNDINGSVAKDDLWNLYRGAESSSTTIIEQNIGGLNFTVNVDSNNTEMTVTEVDADDTETTLNGAGDTNFTSEFNLILQYGVTTGSTDTEAGVLSLQNLNMANTDYSINTGTPTVEGLDSAAFGSLKFTQTDNALKQQNLIVQIDRASSGLGRDNLASHITAVDSNDTNIYEKGPSSKAGDEGGTIVDGVEDGEVIPFAGIAAGTLGDSNAGLESLATLPAGLNSIGPLLASDGVNNDVQTASDSVPGDSNISVSHRQQDDFPAASDTNTLAMSFSKSDFLTNNALSDPNSGTNPYIKSGSNILSESTAKSGVYSVIDDFAFKVNAIDPDTLVTLDSSGAQIQDSNVPGVHNQIARFCRRTTRKANVDADWTSSDDQLDLDDAFSAAAGASKPLSQKVRHFDEDEKVVIVGDLNLDSETQTDAFNAASTQNVQVTVPDLDEDSSSGSIELFNQDVYLVLVQKGLHTDTRWEYDANDNGGSRMQGTSSIAVATDYSYDSANALCAGSSS